MKRIPFHSIARAITFLLAVSLLKGYAADKHDKDQPRPQKQEQGNQGHANPNHGNPGSGGGSANPSSVHAKPAERADRYPAGPNRNPDEGHTAPSRPAKEQPNQLNRRPTEPATPVKTGPATNPTPGPRGERPQEKKNPTDERPGSLAKGPESKTSTPAKNPARDDTRNRSADPAEARPVVQPVDKGKPSPRREPESHAPTQRVSTPGGYEEKTAAGQVRTRAVRQSDGESIQRFNATGGKQSEEVRKANGTVQKTDYDLGGRVKQTEVINKNGREVTTHQVGRSGGERKETVHYNVNNTVVSKTIVRNVTVNKNVVAVSHHYDRGYYGYVYRPVYVAHPYVFASWYDPYWYQPGGVVVVHPFHYSWSWQHYGWYNWYHGPYWTTYEVYPTPSYWLTDWMVAGYLADRFESRASAEQAREEARLAREEAAKAMRLAQEAKDQAEIAEAKLAQSKAECRAKDAEERAARAEREEAKMKELAGKPNPNATALDKQTKEDLRNQIEKTIAEKKQFAEQSEKGGNPPLPDVRKALANPKHIYPVSKTIDVTLAANSNERVALSEGDLLRLEPGQEADLKDATENTFLTLRVMASKGEDGGAKAGQLISVPIRDLQEFDNEFRAKLDDGLAEAEKNKDLFKQGAVAQ